METTKFLLVFINMLLFLTAVWKENTHDVCVYGFIIVLLDAQTIG